MNIKHIFNSKPKQGSFLIAGVFFTVIFLMIAGLAVDASRYLYKTSNWQQVADNAAFAGAQALNQYTDDPDISKAYTAVLDFIEDTLGPEYRDLYEVISDTEVEGIEVRAGTDNDDRYYRVGLLVYGTFDPYFMPSYLFGGTTFVKTAVAELNIGRLLRVEQIPIDCGLFSNGDITLSGDNFNTTLDGTPAALCANGDIDASGSANGILGDMYSSGYIYPPGGAHGDLHSGEPEREQVPDFIYKDPNHPGYDVIINDENFETWEQCNGNSRQLTTKDGQQIGQCITKTGDGEFAFTDSVNLDSESILTGDSIGIYVQGSLNFTRNGNVVDGGIYAQGDITVEGNNNKFIGNKDKLGGLSLWAEETVSVSMNNIEIEGITGAGGRYEFTSPPVGGGDISGFRGLLVTNDFFFSADNSENTRFHYDPEVFDHSAMDMSGWMLSVQRETDRPDMAHTSIRLIH